MSIMFRTPIPGYKTEIVGPRDGSAVKLTVPRQVHIGKAQVWEVTCQSGENVEVSWLPLDGLPTTKTLAIQSACDRYRKVFELRPSDHINVKVEAIKPKVKF